MRSQFMVFLDGKVIEAWRRGAVGKGEAGVNKERDRVVPTAGCEWRKRAQSRRSCLCRPTLRPSASRVRVRRRRRSERDSTPCGSKRERESGSVHWETGRERDPSPWERESYTHTHPGRVCVCEMSSYIPLWGSEEMVCVGVGVGGVGGERAAAWTCVDKRWVFTESSGWRDVCRWHKSEASQRLTSRHPSRFYLEPERVVFSFFPPLGCTGKTNLTRQMERLLNLFSDLFHVSVQSHASVGALGDVPNRRHFALTYQKWRRLTLADAFNVSRCHHFWNEHFYANSLVKIKRKDVNMQQTHVMSGKWRQTKQRNKTWKVTG